MSGAPLPPGRVLVAGDIHGAFWHFNLVVLLAERWECELVLQAGDFGWYPRKPRTADAFEVCASLLRERGVDLVFVEGNHDDVADLRARPVESAAVSPFVRLRDPSLGGRGGVWWAPRGARWEWAGVRFLAVGGAYSIDRQHRRAGVDWFPEEALTDAEVDAILADPAPVDVLVSHDCPARVDHRLLHAPQAGTVSHQERLRRICLALQPRRVYHGHLHAYHYTVHRDGDWRALVVGLSTLYNPEHGLAVIDLGQLSRDLHTEDGSSQ